MAPTEQDWIDRALRMKSVDQHYGRAAWLIPDGLIYSRSLTETKAKSKRRMC